MTVRNNSYHNVRKGPGVKAGQKSGSPVTLSGLSFGASGDGFEATAQTGTNNHNLKAGDRVELVCTPSSLNGLFVVTEIVSLTSFKYFTPGPTGTLTSGTMEKIFGTGKLVMEGNTIELGNGADGEVAVELDDNALASQAPDHVHGEVEVRRNRFSYVDEVHDSGDMGTGLRVRGAKQLNVQDNLVDLEPADPLQDLRSGTVTYFNNETPDGTLIRGFKDDTDQKYDELETEAEDALILAFFNHK